MMNREKPLKTSKDDPTSKEDQIWVLLRNQVKNREGYVLKKIEKEAYLNNSLINKESNLKWSWTYFPIK